MTLIDADALKQAILSIMPERSEVLLIVDNQPEGIVRCKDCIFHEKSIKGKGYCCGTCDGLGSVDDDWFCADGERR